MRLFSLLITCLAIFPAFSQWQLNQDLSQINFVTIKKQHIAENQRFDQFSGQVTKGKVNISINLASVNTNIGIRDERMKEHLFNISTFPTATFSADITEKVLNTIAVGQTKRLTVSGTISLHGVSQKVQAEVLVAKLSKTSMLVTSMQPLLIKAKDFTLIEGINTLQKLAGLPSIGYTVPLSFVLVFERG